MRYRESKSTNDVHGEVGPLTLRLDVAQRAKTRHQTHFVAGSTCHFEPALRGLLRHPNFPRRLG
jgi:hypothetical protein